MFNELQDKQNCLHLPSNITTYLYLVFSFHYFNGGTFLCFRPSPGHLTLHAQGDSLARDPKQIWEKYSRIWRNAFKCAWM